MFSLTHTLREKLALEKLNIIRKITQAKQLRVRDHNGLARIEVGRDERQIFFKTKIMDIIAKEHIELGF
jgi:PP-loop superfamily ATP-utilizing enzyme